jgi:hypothetical protein
LNDDGGDLPLSPMQPDKILFQRRGADPEARDGLIVRKLPLANTLARRFAGVRRPLDRASILVLAA